MGSAHDGSIYGAGSQTNRVYMYFLAHLGEPLTSKMIEAATDTTAPATLVSTVRRQLPRQYRMGRTTIEDAGKKVSAWVLDRVEKESSRPVASRGQRTLFGNLEGGY